MKSKPIAKKELEDLVNEVDYNYLLTDYEPSQFALEFITFIKLVNGSGGEENKSPIIHMDMLDNVLEHDEDLFVSFRGSAKTTALHEYMFLYLAVYGKIPNFGTVDVAMYISDTIDNGVKSMRQNLEFRWNKSEFLQKYIPYTRFTDVRWEFKNLEGKSLCVRGFGASTGVRGFKEYGKRPTWCGFDDLMSDKNAESATIVRDIKNIIYKAARQAMHPSKRKIVWTGTPFNKKDPLYEAAGSKSWDVKIYPICEKFPCKKEEFRGAWEDRFNYDFVKNEYKKLLGNGEIAAFNQELMLRIASEEDRLVSENDIVWYESSIVQQNKSNYNFYITTDFATSEKNSADYSVISVWAYNNNGDWLWVDGTIKRQLMDQNIDDVFRFVSMYKPQSVGVEVTGQQGGFIQWIKDQMLVRNIFFNLASEGNSGKEGIRPNTNKMVRFNTIVPMFKQKKVWFPKDKKNTSEMIEIMEEIRNATISGFKSKHDDFCFTGDTKITMADGSIKFISMIDKGDLVMTSGVDTLTMLADSVIMTGYKEVQSYLLSNGNVLSCTDNHPILTTRGYVPAIELLYTDIVIGLKKCKLQHTESNGQDRKVGTINLQQTSKVNEGGYTNGLGNLLMDHNLKDLMYITGTTIKMTILLGILSLFPEVSIRNTMGFRETSANRKSTYQKSDLSLKNGINLKKVGNGIKKMLEIIPTDLEKIKNVCVDTAELQLCHISNQEEFSVLISANRSLYERMLKAIRRISVKSVQKTLSGIEENHTAHLTVQRLQEIVPENRRKEMVYNFEVHDTHNYVANGTIVHNCDTVSMLSVMNPWKPSEQSADIKQKDDGVWVTDYEDDDYNDSYEVF